MNTNGDMLNLELVCVIVNDGLGSRLVKSAKRKGFSGGTITYGKGTANNRLLDYFGLSDIRKEIIYLAADQSTAYQALDKINNEFEFHKPNHGIVFTTSMCSVYGSKNVDCHQLESKRGANKQMYHVITIIVDKGNAEDVVRAAEKAGSKGGTILNGRGSGVHETSKVFAMEIELEKEVVLILSEVDRTEAIVSSIRKDLKIDEPGNGIIFVQDVNKTYGILK
jgi:nitrogen regulatory protein PII